MNNKPINTLRKIGFVLYENWFVMTSAIIAILHFTIGIPFWKWEWLPISFFILAIYSANNGRPFFAPIRQITWPIFKADLIRRSQNSLLSFPLLVYLETEGRNMFIANGWSALRIGIEIYLTKTAKKLEAVITGSLDQVKKD